MRLTYLWTACALTARALLRRRIVLLMLFVIPTLFFALIVLTTTDRAIAFQLASLGAGVFVEVSQRQEGLVFIGLAAVGVLTAFLAMDLIQRDAEVTRRLVLCGYRPWELAIARLVVLAGVIAAVGTYVVVLLLALFRPQHLVTLWAGFLLGGWVYGCYGLLVGALFRRELEGILFVVLLANIDVGWLQNPIYYASAQSQAVIRSLPAYFPSQVSMAAAFTEHGVLVPALQGLAYGAALLAAALVVYGLRTRRSER